MFVMLRLLRLQCQEKIYGTSKIEIGEANMKIEQPYSCDKCGTYKQKTDDWFIAWSSKDQAVSENKKGVTLRSAAIVVVPWNDKLKDRSGVSHLCSSRCVTAFVAEEIARMSLNNARNPVQGPQPPPQQAETEKPKSAPVEQDKLMEIVMG